jgi:hypothetical protein
MTPEQSYSQAYDTILAHFDSSPVDANGKPRQFVFEIREGDGNAGEYHRCDIMATSASEALILAHRHGFIRSPWDIRITRDIDGDNVNAYVVSYVKPIFGDSCRWSASASLCIDARNVPKN